jgi:signal transduction histidine kinase
VTQVAHRPATVVLIDDTPDLRLLLRVMLELSDRYDVIAEAGDGATGIEAVREAQPDLVLLDLAMPVMDGLEALPEIRRACPTATVVVLSGFEADRMADQALARGAAAYLQKGTGPDEMVRAIDAVLGARRGVALPRQLPAKHDVKADELATFRTALATAAHELRTPATVLLGLAGTLLERRSQLSTQQVDELLDAIVRQTRVLDRITTDLLTSTQIDRGGLNAQSEPVDLMPIVRSVAAAVADQVAVHVDGPESLEVVADWVRVQQMLTNLVTNAIRYAAPPISISVSGSSDGVAVVQVDDTGDGVPTEFRPRLFEQYSRADGARTAGTGLGLYVVRALAEAQGGTAWYRPRKTGGSSFGFTLPRH